MILVPETVAPVTSVTPTSLFGWGGFVFGLVACGTLLYDRVFGKGKTAKSLDDKIERLCEAVERIETAQGNLDTDVREVSQAVRDFLIEWKGLEGTNGWRSVIRQNSKDIKKILDRNLRIDAVRQRDREEGGGQRRRAMDQVLDDDDADPENER